MMILCPSLSLILCTEFIAHAQVPLNSYPTFLTRYYDHSVRDVCFFNLLVRAQFCSLRAHLTPSFFNPPLRVILSHVSWLASSCDGSLRLVKFGGGLFGPNWFLAHSFPIYFCHLARGFLQCQTFLMKTGLVCPSTECVQGSSCIHNIEIQLLLY